MKKHSLCFRLLHGARQGWEPKPTGAKTHRYQSEDECFQQGKQAIVQFLLSLKPQSSFSDNPVGGAITVYGIHHTVK